MKWKKIDLPHDSRGLVPFVQKAPGIKNNYFDFIASKSSPSIISDDQSKGLDTYQNSAASQLPF
ncbi:hypothetical protein TWF102_011501 [Orbilia oligospora]|uniref:Uncharacterized protein n=1 Tax=Orbilia oligospora TaxID=2813651 RepID=A0A7C8NVS9_ORBOL|nr:hypothetical protein TWF102_011501 [Orbilia oligospora]